MDTLTPEERSERMGRVRNRDTKPELKVRRLLHRMGYRYRLHARDIPGRPDVVFRKRRKAIFVHGCFWHRHPDPACPLARTPKSRHEFWEAKFAANVARDARVADELSHRGWGVFTVWECQLRDTGDLERRLREFLGA
jgi:DNA mismatch endonuclease (patch repair protein)